MSMPATLSDEETSAPEMNLDKIISINRNSIVSRTVLQGRPVIGKCYTPDRYPEYQRQYAGFCSPPFLKPFSEELTRRYCFQKELDLYQFSSQLPEEERFSSILEGVDPETKTFFTKIITIGNYGEHFLQVGNNYGQKAESLLHAVNQLHAIFGHHHQELYQCSRTRKSSRLKPRNKEEDYERYLNYFRTIIRRTSDSFRAYSAALPSARGESKTAPLTMNKQVDRFLSEVGVKDLREVVDDFVNRDWEICYGKKSPQLIDVSKKMKRQLAQLKELYQEGIASVVHGDVVNPDNIFYMKDYMTDKVLACDFAEVRVDQRALDVAGALFNPYNMPKSVPDEIIAIELMGKYVEKVHANELVPLDNKDFVVRCLETRLRDHAVRLFAIDSGYIPAEIRVFASRLQEFDSPENDEELHKKFLQEMFIRRFTDFTEHYLRAEGRASLEDIFGKQGALLVEQIRLVENLYTAAGVMASSPSAKRQEHVKEIIES